MISTLTSNHFHSMRCNEFTYRSIVFQDVLIWNTLIQNIRISISYPRFKHLLRDLLSSNIIAFRYKIMVSYI